MKITVKKKQYEVKKIVRDKYKAYSEVRDTLINKDNYSDEDIDKMVKVLVKIYDNQFTEEDINEDLDISDILLNFTMIDYEVGKNMNNKIEKLQKMLNEKK